MSEIAGSGCCTPSHLKYSFGNRSVKLKNNLFLYVLDLMAYFRMNIAIYLICSFIFICRYFFKLN